MNDQFVLDCSVTMAWFFQGEATPATDSMLDQLQNGGRTVVAGHWPLEVGNTLLQGERRKRCTATDSTHFVNILDALAIEVDRETGTRALADTMVLARSQNLTLYDAAYLELAMRRKLPLATLDSDLRKAAKKVGVSCLPDRL